MEIGRLSDCPRPASEEFWSNLVELIFRKDSIYITLPRGMELTEWRRVLPGLILVEEKVKGKTRVKALNKPSWLL